MLVARRAWLTAADVLNTRPFDTFRASLRDSVERYGRLPVTDVQWAAFAEGVRYARYDLTTPDGLAPLRSVLEEVDLERGTAGNRVYYLSIPPSGIADVARGLGEAGMSSPPGPSRAAASWCMAMPVGTDWRDFSGEGSGASSRSPIS